MIRLAFYGDDFTGSTDALEVLAFAGMQTALLLKPPTPEVLAHFPKLDAVGVAGDTVEIRDDGPGFPPDMLSSFPALMDTRKETGTGIGLALAQTRQGTLLGFIQQRGIGHRDHACDGIDGEAAAGIVAARCSASAKVRGSSSLKL